MDDVRRLARRRMPFVAWEYLDSGTGAEDWRARDRSAFEEITLTPRFFRDARDPDLSTELLGVKSAAPFGIAPVGLQSLMWPGAEKYLARAAADAGVPYVLSTMSGSSPEEIGEASRGSYWFQLYCSRDTDVRRDLLARAKATGAKAVVVTIDTATSSRRERQKRAGVGMPPRLGLRGWLDLLMHPAWVRETLARGKPAFVGLERYASKEELAKFADFVNRLFTVAVTPETIAEIRQEWEGPLYVKGIMHPDDARLALDLGVDGIWVSNHGGRQGDLHAPAIKVLPGIVEAVDGRAPVVFDSGVRDGADAARAIAAGADMAFLGRAMVMGVAAFGEPGAAHVIEIVRDELRNVIAQAGCMTPAELRERLA